MAAPTPNAGTGVAADLERYLVPSIVTAPTAASQQDGLMPGIPVPYRMNSDATFGVTGSFRPDQPGYDGSDPRIYVYATDLGKAPAPTPPVGSTERNRLYLLYAFQGLRMGMSGAEASAWGRKMAEGIGRETSGAISVPRFGIQRWDWDGNANDSEVMGVDVSFRVSSALDVVPNGKSSTWMSTWPAPLLVAADGTLRLLMLCAQASNKYVLEMWKFDQSQSNEWTRWVTQELCGTGFTDALLATTPTFTGFDACVVNNDIYVMLSGYNELVEIAARVWTLRITGGTSSTAAVELLTDAKGIGSVNTGHTSWTPAPAGGSDVAVVYTPSGFLLARALSSDTVKADSTLYQKIAFARSPDGITWGATGNTYSATSISITGGNTIHDAATTPALPMATPGDTITLTGTTASDGTYTVVSRTASNIVVGAGLLTNQSAGSTITVTVTTQAPEFTSDYQPVVGIALAENETVTHMGFASASQGFAVTDQGRIFYTNAGGRTWAEQDPPTRATRNAAQKNIPLRHVYCRPRPDTYTAATISTTSKTLSDSAQGLPKSGDAVTVAAGDKVAIVSAENTIGGTFTVATVSANGSSITFDETIGSLSAGEEVTITPIVTAFAVGDDHVVLKTKTGGARWAVFWSAKVINGVTSVWDAADQGTSATDGAIFTHGTGTNAHHPFGNDVFAASDWTTPTAGWLATDTGYVVRVSNAAAATTPDSEEGKQFTAWLTGSAPWRCLSRDPTTPTLLIAAGAVGVNSRNADASKRTHRFLHIGNAGGAPTWTPLDVSGARADGDPDIVAIAHVSSSGSGHDALAVDASGAVLFYDHSPTPTWSVRAQLPGTDIRPLDLRVLVIDAVTYVIITGSDAIGGLVWRSMDAGVSWISERVATPLRTGIFSEVDAGVVAGSGIWYTDSFNDLRVMPSLCVLDSGAVLFAACNTSKARLEIYRADTAQSPFLLTHATTISASVDGYGSDTWTASGIAAASSFAVDANGDVLLAVAQDGFVSLDDGRTWRRGADSSLALPLGRLDPTATPTATYPASRIVGKRRLARYRGRLWSTTTKETDDGIGIFTAREFNTNAQHYHPVWPGVPQWVGVDDVHIIWAGYPATNDVWQIVSAYRYPARHIVIGSPSVLTRSEDNAGDWTIDWDRKHSTTTAVMGSGSHFVASGIALFGTNFKTASLRCSVVGYDTASFPTSPSDWTTVIVSAVVEDSVLISSTNGGLYSCVGVDWTPDQYAPGLRTYYCQINNSSVVKKILGNTATALITEDDGSYTPSFVTIFSDRMCALFDEKWFRWGRILVPELITSGQAIYGARRQIGTAIIGRHSTVTADRRRHSGMVWEPVPVVSTARSLTGATSTETFHRPQQRWRLPYEWAEAWDRDARMLPMLPRLRDPFALVFNGSDTQTVELVRLTDSVSSTNVLHNRWADTWELEEVV